MSSYVNGFVAAENTWLAVVRPPPAETELRERTARHLERHRPQLAEPAQVGGVDDFDVQFELWLTLIRDGIQSRL
ncbi:hypothetical protein AB0G05_42030 [Nonomuraea wenchangensis]